MPKITIFSMAYLTLALAGFAQMPPAHFHHIHLNTTEPAAAIDFYRSKFDCEKAKFAGEWDGVWAQKAWILFNKVTAPPPSAEMPAPEAVAAPIAPSPVESVAPREISHIAQRPPTSEAGPTRRWLKVKQKGWTDAEDRWQRRISARA
jgi:catechol 2,3-dioxygenase-like lactoylglutathione lyase family enzyme